MNSVLINFFPTSDCFISRHADDEPVILANSDIVTLSIGGSRTIRFKQSHPVNDNSPDVDMEVTNNSIYSMTRSSQAWYQHEVLPSQINEERFSLTFRSLDPKFRRSVAILGDSNTKDIQFGEGSGRVGASYPGKRVATPKASKINVNECIGYSNIFVCCGTNSLRCEDVKNDRDIYKAVDELQLKLRGIKQLCPKSKIFVSPVLPSRIPQMNGNIMMYNEIVDSMLRKYFPDIWFKDVYSFLDSQDLLSTKFTRANDKIHLGPRGIAKFVSHIKLCVFSREASNKYKNDSNVSVWEREKRRKTKQGSANVMGSSQYLGS